MDLYEYQARELFAAHGVPVLAGIVASTPDEAFEAAQKLLGENDLLVVKAQVKIGGRGKAGGVKLARTAEEAREKAQEILGMDIKGHTVHKVLIAAGADIAEEYYFSILLDRSCAWKAKWASSVTALAWSCRPWTLWPWRVRNGA